MFWKPILVLTAAIAISGMTPAQAQPQVDVLIFDMPGGTQNGVFASVALGYTHYQATWEEDFLEKMRIPNKWELVIFELPRDMVTKKEEVAGLLEDHVAAGGRLLVNFNNLDEWPRLQRLLGVDDAIEMLVPEDVEQTDPLHASWPEPWFNTPLPVHSYVWTDSGDRLVPSKGSVIVGQFPDLSGAIVLREDRLTLANGFNWEENRASSSFVREQIRYIMACPADLDQSTGREVLDIFDFLEFQDLFVNQDPLANMAFDANFDIFDFLAFQNAFVNGCG